MGLTAPLHGQQASVQGRVTHSVTGEPLRAITVSVAGSRAVTLTDSAGRYRLVALEPGERRIRFSWLGQLSHEVGVQLGAGATETVDAVLDPDPLPLAAITVESPSRQPERVVDAPAAVSVVPPARLRDLSITAQAPLAVADLPGVYAPQSGTHDFSLNARGFNSPINRRMLVLVDGRDVAIPILGNQEWPTVSLFEEGTRVELVRGPGSALYGANAFAGVLNIVTPSVRQALGTRMSVAGGELSTLKLDARHAGITQDLRWGYRMNASFVTSNSWDKARTEIGHLGREYADAIDTSRVQPPQPGYELRALRGQMKEGTFGLPGVARGDPDAQRTWDGAARLDHYLVNGAVVTAEGGAAYAENYVVTTTAGRSQNYNSARPWARLAVAAEDFNITAWYTGRTGTSYSLNSGARARETSRTLHAEGQWNRRFADTRGRFVLGASARRQSIDSRGTLFDPDADGRSDEYFAAFGQVEFLVHPKFKLVAAGRVDEGSLFELQFSPRLGAVFSPRPDHALRLTANRAYLTPSALERFIAFPVAAPLDLRLLEAGLRASPLGPALAGVPDGTLFTNSAAVPVLLLGNQDLDPQQVRSLELGYKGEGRRWFLTADAFYNEIDNFVTGARAGVNARYPDWTAPGAVPEIARGGLEQAVLGAVGTGITRLSNGSTAFVLSLGNGGRAQSWGLELATGAQLGGRVRVEANYAYQDFELEDGTFEAGDSVQSNTPRNSANFSVSYQSGDRLRMHAGLRLVEAFDWHTGFYRGRVPSSQTVDLTASYALSPSLRLALAGTNVLDQQRYHVFGGSIVERRVLAGLTWTRR
jgi:outer membrane receptor protein involved in Fe transport